LRRCVPVDFQSAKPRWFTERTASRDTLGHEALKISRLLGQEFMPWQRDVADVALELDGNGQLVYRDVGLTVPRQQGKSTLMLSLILARCLVEKNQHVVYCAQSALDARKQWANNWVPAIEQSLLGSQTRVRLAPGDEGLWFPTGSHQSIAASTVKAGHGQIVDTAIVDEAFSYQDDRIEQALRPAMMTRSRPGMLGAQFWIVSTVGVPSFSTYLHAKTERGRAAADDGMREGTCYFEYSARDDEDPGDPATWRGCMPALGFTVDENTIRAAFESMSRSEFRRAFLNQWVTSLGDPIVPIDQWNMLERPDALRPDWVVLGVDVDRHDAHAAIVALGESGDGLQGSVLESGERIDWLLPSLSDRVAEFESPFVVVDERACQHLLPELERIVGFDRLIVRRSADVPTACSFWLRLVQQSRLWHRGEPELTAALVAAGQRRLGDGWAWSRSKSGADISPLVAMTLAASFWHGHELEGEVDA
jgi:phage terminase large subunit-like protein